MDQSVMNKEQGFMVPSTQFFQQTPPGASLKEFSMRTIGHQSLFNGQMQNQPVATPQQQILWLGQQNRIPISQNWQVLPPQPQQNWFLQQMEYYRLAQRMAMSNSMASQPQGFRPHNERQSMGGFPQMQFQPQFMPGQMVPPAQFSFLQSLNNRTVQLAPQSQEEDPAQWNAVKKVHKNQSTEGSSTPNSKQTQRLVALGRPKKSSSIEDKKTILESSLIKRSSSDLNPKAEPQDSLSKNEVTESENTNAEASGQETEGEIILQRNEKEEAVSLIAKLEGDKGFEIIKPTITTVDMAFIRNYSRIIGYPLKTTQRNTKLGYFTSICTHEGCPVSIIIRKFKLITSPVVQHNH